MEDIIAHARELGKKIAAHPRSIGFMTAARAVAADKQAQEILRAYQNHARNLHELEASGKPIEPEDKRKLADCEAAIAGNELLKQMMKHQADYLELMNLINNAIDEAAQG
jgi:cell fate (sporulation/competence/biofilm development) regulator YlbF (YheA/YmcA/DUF963 family)